MAVPHRYAMDELLGVTPDGWRAREDSEAGEFYALVTEDIRGIFVGPPDIINLEKWRVRVHFNPQPRNDPLAALRAHVSKRHWPSAHTAMSAVDTWLQANP